MATYKESQDLLTPSKKLSDIKSWPVGTKTKRVIQDPTDTNTNIILASGDVMNLALAEGVIHPIQSIGYGGGNGSPGTSVPVFFAAFDGAEPYSTNFNGSDDSYNGITPSSVNGGEIFRPGKFGKARQVAEGTTNLVVNPIAAIDLSSWSLFNTGVSMVRSETPDAQFGTTVFRCDAQSNVSSNMGMNYNASGVGIVITDGGDYTLSFLARGTGIWSPSLYNGTTSTIIDIDLTNDWTLYKITLTANSDLIMNARPGRAGTSTNPGDWMEITGVQLEEKSYATPFAYGDMPGVTWSGTAHASTSVRVSQQLTYDSVAIPTYGTIAFWYKRTNEPVGQEQLVAGVTGDNFFVSAYENGGSYYFRNRIGNTAFNALLPIQTFLDWTHVVFLWDSGGTQYTYINGAFVNSLGYTVTVQPDELRIQTTTCGFIDDLVLFNRALTATEIANIYNSNAPYDPTRNYS